MKWSGSAKTSLHLDSTVTIYSLDYCSNYSITKNEFTCYHSHCSTVRSLNVLTLYMKLILTLITLKDTKSWTIKT